ncbi:hypothetical protein O7621_12010 [Solwaraspora sp. WMMD937]|uniref:Cap15 family cyclic dinucleotide receptor domain-containing protein n=1 Tax=Solwaraspora sp. WMMD937 TaxID=3016090 RepID=UPI00249B0F39|nr:hypothetical protein [Solwaraspora sp. WMMD937]WFE23927.1 hypothetical protein O7621_12010 [Solwaraspora sp. WMMD937]
MNRTITIRVVASIVVLVFATGTWLTNGQLDPAWIRLFSAAVLAASVILGLWDLWVWRLPLAQHIPGVPRCIRGTWQGTLTSFWIDPETGQPPRPKTVYLVVRQTATLVAVSLLTDESRSTSTLANVRTIDGSSSLTTVYLNRPDIRVEHRSKMHHGSMVLDISGRPACRMIGRYWTDRDSKGELVLSARHKKLADDFSEAAQLFTEEDQRKPLE